MIIRDARAGDVPQIVEIANALLASTTIEWTERPHTVEDRRLWLAEHQKSGDPVLVAERGAVPWRFRRSSAGRAFVLSVRP